MPDRIILKGLGYKRIINLDSISEIRWSSDLLAIGLEDGDEVDLMIQSAALWKFELQARCNLKDVKADSHLKTEQAPESDENQPRASSFEFSSVDTPNTPEAFPEDLFEDPLPQRESSYRLKSGFAEDRPQSER